MSLNLTTKSRYFNLIFKKKTESFIQQHDEDVINDVAANEDDLIKVIDVITHATAILVPTNNIPLTSSWLQKSVGA